MSHQLRWVITAVVLIEWWPETESNRRHKPFQGSALPTELSGRPTQWTRGLELFEKSKKRK